MDSNQRHCFIAQAEPRKRRQAERPVSGIVSLPRPDYNPHFIVVDDLSTPPPTLRVPRQRRYAGAGRSKHHRLSSRYKTRERREKKKLHHGLH
jgi:hypothetical protein